MFYLLCSFSVQNDISFMKVFTYIALFKMLNIGGFLKV